MKGGVGHEIDVCFEKAVLADDIEVATEWQNRDDGYRSF